MTPADILLVDDEPRNLDVLEAILEDPGHRLLRAEDADTALKLLLNHDVAAIVLDIKMPGVSGFELAQVIKGTKRFRQIPIVFLTAHLLDEKDVMTGYGAGAVDYLTKPVNPKILRHKVGVFVELFQKTRALAELNETLEERVRERTAELERSEAALRTAHQQKDEFIAILAHELRNPLAPIRFGIDLLLDLGATDAAAERTLSTMSRQLDHVVRLVDDLLDTSRISRGVLELKMEDIDLAKSVEQAVEGVRVFAEGREQNIHLELEREVHVRADQTRVVQILGNLLHNAIKFTPEHGDIRVELGRTERGVAVRVIDAGQGIAPEDLPHLFDMFWRRGMTAYGADRAMGIGLSLARRLTELHAGTLTVDSAGRGMGTTFTLELPVVDAQPSPSAAAAAREAEEAAAGLRRILLVEDNDDLADTTAAWLEQLGHRVTVARGGASALEQIESDAFDVVLCDLGLPDIDGLEVCRRARELPKSPRPFMVAMTGWGREDDRRRTKEAGFDHHLVKPVAPTVLRALLRDLEE
jgi:signal transduction histidine kinase